jgi:hypothetical protein
VLTLSSPGSSRGRSSWWAIPRARASSRRVGARQVGRVPLVFAIRSSFPSADVDSTSRASPRCGVAPDAGRIRKVMLPVGTARAFDVDSGRRGRAPPRARAAHGRGGRPRRRHLPVEGLDRKAYDRIRATRAPATRPCARAPRATGPPGTCSQPRRRSASRSPTSSRPSGRPPPGPPPARWSGPSPQPSLVPLPGPGGRTSPCRGPPGSYANLGRTETRASVAVRSVDDGLPLRLWVRPRRCTARGDASVHRCPARSSFLPGGTQDWIPP